MAAKTTYLYKISVGHSKPEKVVFCYARNADTAIKGYKQIFKDEKYDYYSAVMFGNADRKRHPGPFEIMTKEEADIVINKKLADADAYSNRREPMIPRVIPSGEFVPVEGAVT